jgi:hypothetical protein
VKSFNDVGTVGFEMKNYSNQQVRQKEAAAQIFFNTGM